MKVLNCLASAALLAALAGSPVLAQMSQEPQQQPTQTQPNQPQAEQPGATNPSAQQAQAFTGTIIKTKDGYALHDESSKSAYMLDDQTQAKKFSGKNVKVTGMLDSSTNTIHISNIELVSNSY